MAEQEVGQKGKTYGLLLPKKGQTKIQVKSVFGDDSDEENAHDAVNSSLQKEAEKLKMKRKTQLEIDKALEADPTVYEYDSIYDSIQEKKEQQVSSSSSKTKVEKKPKYIEGLLKASEKRKKDYERQQERAVQKEREKEGNEFADKEVFVTGAYRKKMQEMQEAEEEERRQAAMEEMLDVKKQKDMTGFYRYLLKEKTGENVKTEKEDSGEKKDQENLKTDDENEDKSKQQETGEDIQTENTRPVIKKEQTENKERRRYRARKSSSSSRSSSGSRSPQRRSTHKKSKGSNSSSENEDSTPEKVKHRSRSSEKKLSKDKQEAVKSRDKKSNEDMSAKTKNGEKSKNKSDTKVKRSRSSSSSSSGEEVSSKKRKSDEKEEKKTEKYDRELTIEEIKARYARRTTPEMIEAARERYFIRKMEREHTKPYIFKSDE